jgi:WD40 repeat protein
MSFSPTAISMLATASIYVDDGLRVWNIDSGEMIRGIEGCHPRVAIFSPDGRTIASVFAESLQGDVLLMDAESGEMRLRMVGHTRPINAASWCPYDGSKLASGGEDGTSKVWDSSTGELLRSINLGRPVYSMVWGRDWVRDTQEAMAFAMGHHPRLGAESQVLELEAGVVRMILDRV